MAPLFDFSDDEDDLYVRSDADATSSAQRATDRSAGHSSTRRDRADPIIPGDDGMNRSEYSLLSSFERTTISEPGSTANLLGERSTEDEDLDATPPASPSNRRSLLWPASRTSALPIASSLRDRRSPSPDGNNNTSSTAMRRMLRSNTYSTYDDRFQSTWSARPDLVARRNLQDLISSIILSLASTSARRAMLEDCAASVSDTALPMDRTSHAHSANALGVPFRELISEPMGELDVPPLLYELMQCQPRWEELDTDDHGMEVVEFLIDHWHEDPSRRGRRGTIMGVIREACWRRDEAVAAVTNDPDPTRHALAGVETEGNMLFQLIRSTVVEHHPVWKQKPVDYEIALTEYMGTRGPMNDLDSWKSFKAMILVKDFEKVLNRPAFPDLGNQPLPGYPTIPTVSNSRRNTYSINQYQNTTKMPGPPPKPTPVFIEFIAAERAWSLQIHKDEATLTLLDGPDVTVNIPVPDLHSHSSDPSDPFADPCVPSFSSPSPSTSDAITTTAPTLLFANLRITLPSGSDPFQILFPIKSVRPATHPGTCSVSVKPFSVGFGLSRDWGAELGGDSQWRPSGFDDPRLLNDGMLIVECEVRLRVDRRSPGVVRALEKAKLYYEAMGLVMPEDGFGAEKGKGKETEKCESTSTGISDHHPPSAVPLPTPQLQTDDNDDKLILHDTEPPSTPPSSTSPSSSSPHRQPSPVSLSQHLSLSPPNPADDGGASESEWEILTDDGSKHETGSETDGESSMINGWVKA